MLGDGSLCYTREDSAKIGRVGQSVCVLEFYDVGNVQDISGFVKGHEVWGN